MQCVFSTLILLFAALSICAADASQSDKMQIPYTSFQTPTEYRADNDIRTDAVIVYSDNAERIRSWKEKGYIVQTMYGFRTGPDYIKDHLDEVQTMADGTLHTCGPGSYYMVPTENRIKAAIQYFTNAIAAGTSAVIPEEPEFFAITGYSESFKRAWKEYYGEPWQDQTTSIEARYKSERLKAKMEYDIVKAIMDAAEKQNPSVRRMVACHSAVSYYAWGIIYPHYECLMIPNLQEIIGQVWTGTARTACRYEGQLAERTFENGFLEYSSLYNLARGTGKRMWFLMDPLEDNPDRSMEDYHDNYEKTLVASLMFPEVDAYEVMPWPTRIYGRVPDEFATEISSIIAALQDMHKQKNVQLDMGTQGIATFVADSMGWQRGSPHKSNYDCFYGLTLPLIYRGIPIQVAQLERAPEKGYLDPYKVILMSYDIMKPMKPEYNQALADWVKRGGVLVFFGGTDAYNALPEWWRKRGFESPQEDLYRRLGIDAKLISITRDNSGYTELARTDAPYRKGENRKVYRFDLKPFAKSGTIYVRFRDAYSDDGWGPAVFSVKLVSDGKILAQFNAGTEAEKKHISDDFGSILLNDLLRFADADAYWVYRFEVPKGSSPVLEVDMQNQFVVEAASKPTQSNWKLFFTKDSPLLGCHDPSIEVHKKWTLTVSDSYNGGIYKLTNGSGCVVFEHKFGKGRLIHVGIAPSYFASSSDAADLLRAFVAYACDCAGLTYRTQQWMAIRRGKYVAVRTFDGEKRLRGYYVNILDPKIPVIKDPAVLSQKCGLYCDVSSEMSGGPKLLYSSCKVEQKSETGNVTHLRLSGPLKTKGVARIYTGGRSIESVQPAEVKVEHAGDTVLVTLDNNPDGVEVTLNWK